MDRLCVFCGSNAGRTPIYAERTREFGRALAARDIELVYGGGGVGLMNEVAEAVVENGGTAIGVIPRDVFAREEPPEYLSDLLVVDSMAERKATMLEESEAFVALPGGFGTLEELFEVVTGAQLGFHDFPTGVLDIEGFFGPLVRFLDTATEEGFIAEAHRDLLVVEDRPDVLLDELAAQ